MKKIFLSVFWVVSLLFLNTSCEKYLDVNEDKDSPSYVDGYLYLAGIIEAYQGMYWDVRTAAPLTQMQGTTSYTTFAGNYYSSGSDAGGELWRMVYWLQGQNLENMINQSVANENWKLAGIGYAIKAFSWDQLTKYHGEVILKEAFESGRLSFDYDYQKDVYAQVRAWAYKAIEYLGKTDATNYGTKITANDYIYSGDTEKWIKFAYGVLVTNFASLSNKTNFLSEYADSLVYCAEHSFQTSADDATVKVAGGGSSAAYSAYNNFWGTYRANLGYAFFQHEYAVQVFTGTVPKYDETSGDKIDGSVITTYYPYEYADQQIICDTAVHTTGHYDPRVAVKLSTASTSAPADVEAIKAYKYYGGSFTSTTGPIGTAPSIYGRTATPTTTADGSGKWLYRDDAPYVLMTCAEIKQCLAEAYYKMGQKDNALTAFKAGVAADMEFTANYIYIASIGGDKISKATFNTLAADYLAGPFVNSLTASDLTLSHIMMQKWVALYPWGALEAWVDMRKYNYDIDYSGDYPTTGDGWTTSQVSQKWDSDESKIYKGFYLAPAQVEDRKGTYNTLNLGSPCYRIRPRYNSEYVWNKSGLSAILPISGVADNYQCSKPWFVYPDEVPTTK